jgi:serine/threonine-protein kinase
LALLSQAVERDPQFANGWAALATAYGNWSQYSPEPQPELLRRQSDAANRALALDSTTAEAWANLGYITWWSWDFEVSARHWARAIELQPMDGSLHVEQAKFLHMLNRNDEAMREIETAMRLDPTNSHFPTIKAYQLQTAGRLREADTIAAKAIAANPADWVAYVMRAKIALKERRSADAIAACRHIERTQGSNNPFTLGFGSFCYGKAGDTANARRLLAHLEEMSRNQFVSRAVFVWPHLVLGNRDGALRELELSAGAREPDFLLVLRESAEYLWDEPRYKALLRRTKLDRYWKHPPQP